MTCVCVWATVTHDLMTLAGDPCAQAMPGEIEKHLAGGAASADGVINSSDCCFLHHFANFFLERLQFCNDWNRAWDPGPCCSRHLSKWRRRRSQSKQAKPSKLQWIWTPPPKKIDEDARMPPHEASSLAVQHVLGDEDALQVIEKTLQAQPWPARIRL